MAQYRDEYGYCELHTHFAGFDCGHIATHPVEAVHVDLLSFAGVVVLDDRVAVWYDLVAAAAFFAYHSKVCSMLPWLFPIDVAVERDFAAGFSHRFASPAVRCSH